MRKFYRTLIQVEVLTEDPYSPEDLSNVAEDITTGDASGTFRITKSEEVDGPTMAKLLIAQGSDPGFFSLTDDGEHENDLEEQRQDEKRGLYPEHEDPAN